jgi:hypothetical protein
MQLFFACLIIWGVNAVIRALSGNYGSAVDAILICFLFADKLIQLIPDEKEEESNGG